MDFFEIKEKISRTGVVDIYPSFKVRRSKDLMVRGNSFYAIWDEAKGLWSTDEYDVQRLVDKELMSYNAKGNGFVNVKLLGDFSSKMWTEFQNFVKNQPESAHPLDERVTFADAEVKKEDYVSKRLPYSLSTADCPAYDELMSTLYEEAERDKIEWAIGAVLTGESKYIQKFLVFYGEGGTGKSTVLGIIEKLFAGYYTTFDAKSLTSSNNAFATEMFKTNPLVAIQHDGDLSRIEDNTKLNSIVSHEVMTMNEKYKASYMARTNCFLFMGTNKPVRITDAKSGIIRRLIDVRPTGNLVSPSRYLKLKKQIEFELGAIANRCIEKYTDMGKDYYESYRPVDMMFKTDVFFNFVEDNYLQFKEEDGVTLNNAYEMYKKYCEESLVDLKLPKYKFREELKNYFNSFEERARINDIQVRNWYSGFKWRRFVKSENVVRSQPKPKTGMIFEEGPSILDDILKDCPAQMATARETPCYKWADVTTTLKDIDTRKVHYVKIPANHIVIDFDLKDESGKKSLEKNLEEASKWPKTYAELSKSGSGIHLHYIYDGDTAKLSNVYSDGIEVKVFTGDSSLRRKVTKCYNEPIVTVNSGLPFKKEKPMINQDTVINEKMIRSLINKNLKKAYHPGTKPSVEFIYKILEDAYEKGTNYDVTDMRPAVLAFASQSTNHSLLCIKLVNKMHFHSENHDNIEHKDDSKLVFWDVEVFPNLFLVNWKYRGKDEPVHRMINPAPIDIEQLMSEKLIGFNNRRYDNHILYARYLGYTNEELFKLSQRIINSKSKEENKNCFFREAYNLSYVDIYEYCSKKQSLKKWEIELGIHHQELGMKWDEPVPEELWEKVAEYCDNDVYATEAVFDATQEDFNARKILAKLSGLTVNDTTRMHATKIMFGSDKNPQSQFVYTDLSEMFPGYKFDHGVSTYRGVIVGEGGYVEAEPGMHILAALLDVASLHPTSIEQLNLFGPYTKRFSEIKAARIAVKHRDYEGAKNLLGGILSEFMTDDESCEKLAFALKIIINSIYGYTSATFPNAFKDPRNIDNIVAKRGALFMLDLAYEVKKRGYTVAHIKTDSIKIPNADLDIINFVVDFGHKYGYNFEHEATYQKMCLVNDAVYIAKYASVEELEELYGKDYVHKEKDICKENKKHPLTWSATGAQFAHPYVFKTLFSHEAISFEDKCETKTVSSALYLDMNENLGEDEHNYQFVGKAGQFCPIKAGCGGGLLLREKAEGKYDSATGAKGYRWLESEAVKIQKKESDIDLGYFRALVDDAKDNISQYGDFEQFVS